MAGLDCAYRTSGPNNIYIFVINLNLPTKLSIVTLLFHIKIFLRDFLFSRRYIELEPDLRLMRQNATYYTITSNLCHTNSIAVHSIIELVCTLWHI